ncbi:MAG: hypothetical protein GY861_18490 [bacterium]|nr:hypothetical protein [bacterium]
MNDKKKAALLTESIDRANKAQENGSITEEQRDLLIKSLIEQTNDRSSNTLQGQQR